MVSAMTRLIEIGGCDDDVRDWQCHAAEILDVEPKIGGG